ncbi:MAG: cell division protein ZapA [Myxococcota bacterium]|nr:cell division protein ZapA [Myxococcota bacterium]
MSVQISIRGRTYTLRSDEPDEDVEAVARYIEARMESMSQPGLEEYTIALLTALNIASEYHRFRQEVVARVEGFDKEVAAVGAIIEAALPASPENGADN